MTDRVFCRRHDPDGHANWDSGFRPLLDDTCYMCATEQLEQQLAAAHRQGWEQCKMEAVQLTSTTNERGFYRCEKIVRDVITSMEYKGEPVK